MTLLCRSYSLCSVETGNQITSCYSVTSSCCGLHDAFSSQLQVRAKTSAGSGNWSTAVRFGTCIISFHKRSHHEKQAQCQCPLLHVAILEAVWYVRLFKVDANFYMYVPGLVFCYKREYKKTLENL